MTICFDLDGTLLDHHHATAQGLLGLTSISPNLRIYAPEDLERIWRIAELRHFARHERGEISFLEQRRERLREVFPEYCGDFAELQLDALYEHYINAYQRAWRLYPDAIEALDRLEAGPRVLITNGSSQLQRSKVNALNLEEHFEHIIISGEFNVAKPKPEIFLEACQRIGKSPEEVTYVGDSFTNDVEGSFSAGLRAIWLNRDGISAPRTDFPFREIKSLAEL